MLPPPTLITLLVLPSIHAALLEDTTPPLPLALALQLAAAAAPLASLETCWAVLQAAVAVLGRRPWGGPEGPVSWKSVQQAREAAEAATLVRRCTMQSTGLVFVVIGCCGRGTVGVCIGVLQWVGLWLVAAVC